MNIVGADEVAMIRGLAAELIGELEARGFHPSQSADVVTALRAQLAAASNNPGALALVIEAALREMNRHLEPANDAGWSASDAAIAALRPARLSCPGEPR